MRVLLEGTARDLAPAFPDTGLVQTSAHGKREKGARAHRKAG
jgi:hypothetical protein